MKLHLCEVVIMASAIQELSEMKGLHPKIGYWVFKNTRVVKEHCSFYEKRQSELIEKYLFKSPDGNYAKKLEDGTFSPNYKDENSKSGYEEELVKLGDLEIEIDPYLLDYEAIMNDDPKSMPEPKYFNTLDKLIK